MMKKIIFLIPVLAGALIRPAPGQEGIPYAIGAGGQTREGLSAFTLGQTFASPGNHLVGLEHFMWIPRDTTFIYQIGDIPDHQVFHNQDCRFRIGWDDHPGAGYSYAVFDRLDSTLMLKQEKGAAVFEYTPLTQDISSFGVEFIAIDGNDTISQLVQFTPVPVMKPENKLLRYRHNPAMVDTIMVSKSWRKTNKPMNFTGNDTVVRVDIIGKTVVFTSGTEPFPYQNIPNLGELNIYATNLVIRDSVHLPQSKVTLYCENLIFDDTDGVHACINTTPRKPQVSHQTGLNAATFHCYLKKLDAPGNQFRFCVNGGKGSPSMMEGVSWTAPGGGGDAGDFYSNLNLASFVCKEGGQYGKPHEWDPLPTGPRGQKGKFHFEHNQYKWLHPHAVRLMLQYAREHYICAQEEETYRVCNKYTRLINAYRESEYWETDTLNTPDLEQLLYSFSSIRDQLDDRLDYFGNPWGWAPLLSFEANLENYEREIEYAIRVLYLNHWMTDKAASLQAKQEAAELLKSENLDEMMRLKEIYQDAYLDYSPTLLEFKAYTEKLDSLTLMYNQKIEALLVVAKRNVATSWENILRQVGNIASQVCMVIPHPAAQAIGTGLGIASNLDYNDPLSKKNLGVVFDNLNESLEGFSGISDAVSGMIGDLEEEEMTNPGEQKAKEHAKAVVEEMSPDDPLNIGLAIKELTFPDDMVKAEFEKLKSNCPILRVWTDSMEVYSDKKGQMAEKLRFIRYQLTGIPREITNLLLACDAMDDILLSTDNIVDPRAMSYLNEMKNSAWERMLRYHYYMALAYQYRFLKPYEESLNMQPMFESFDTLARQGADLTPDEYNALLPVFQDQLKQISDEIYTMYNDGTYNEHNTRISYTLNDEQLKTLNNTGELKINLWDSGKIPLDHVDCRITNISLDESSLAISSDTILRDAALTIMMAHSGNSSLIHPKTGEHMAFTQYNKDVAEYYNSNRMSPLGWAQKYFFDDGEIITIDRSLASLSLIRSILDVADDNDLLIFTRPAANAEVKIITSLHTGEQANMNVNIDKLALFVNIDYQTASNFSNILINTSYGLMPLIICSEADINGKDYGWGNFTRSYNRNAGTIMFTAPEEHGIYAFDKWLKTTNGVTEEIAYKSVTVNALYHHWITAVYRLNVPELDLPDTVYASWDQTSLEIPVKNSNVCEHTPMEWFGIAGEDWFSFEEGTSKGLEQGSLKLNFTSNFDVERTGKITVYAFNAANPEKLVTIIQQGKTSGIESLIEQGLILRIYPNPALNEILVELPIEFSGRQFNMSIHSFDGRIMHQQLYDGSASGTLRIPVDMLSPGMYILKVVQGKHVCIHRFTKK